MSAFYKGEKETLDRTPLSLGDKIAMGFFGLVGTSMLAMATHGLMNTPVPQPERSPPQSISLRQQCPPCPKQ